MFSGRIFQTYSFDKRFMISVSSRKDWDINPVQLPGKREVWDKGGFEKGKLVKVGVHKGGYESYC